MKSTNTLVWKGENNNSLMMGEKATRTLTERLRQIERSLFLPLRFLLPSLGQRVDWKPAS